MTWQSRQIALIPQEDTFGGTTGSGTTPDLFEGEDLTPGTVVFDEEHDYEMSYTYDHAGRSRVVTYPANPDYAGTAPTVKGDIRYANVGRPFRTYAVIDSSYYMIIRNTAWDQEGRPWKQWLGSSAHNTIFRTFFDLRGRVVKHRLTRLPDMGAAPDTLAALNEPIEQKYVWDDANNLVTVQDLVAPDERIDGHRALKATIAHDALYRVTNADYQYYDDMGSLGSDTHEDYRQARTDHLSADPMGEEPAPPVSPAPSDRVEWLTWQYDWLANMTAWGDDAHAFHERSIGEIGNGFEDGARPSALYVASNVDVASGTNRGWLEVHYGDSGNVERVTVHGSCSDAASACSDPGGDDVSNRVEDLSETCDCAVEQHFQYRWDELNRLSEARRYDGDGSGDWDLAVRHRYRYDSSNQRIIKQVISYGASAEDRVGLYVYPGEFERKGLELDLVTTDSYVPNTSFPTEAQYLISGARVVWKDDPTSTYSDYTLENEVRMTYAVSDLIQSTSAVVDLWSGEMVSLSTFYPNGAQETLWAQDDELMEQEPLGFTGKEADEEVGVTYFGERYLIPRIGRWASPDPLHVHAVGGGEALNSYHYVSGNLLQARDPLGLDVRVEGNEAAATAGDTTATHATEQQEAEDAFLRDVRAGMSQAEARLFEMDNGELVFRGDATHDLSDVAEFWVGMINSDKVTTILPSTVLSSSERDVRDLANGGAMFSVTSDSYGGDGLKLRPAMNAPGLGPIRGSTDEGEAGAVVAYQTNRVGTGLGGRADINRQAAISETLVHEVADHAVAVNAAARSGLGGPGGHRDGWSLRIARGLDDLSTYPGGAAALRRDSDPSHLERAVPLQRQVYEQAHGPGQAFGIWTPLFPQHAEQARFLRGL